MTQKKSEILTLSLENLMQMEKEFPDQYKNLFDFGFKRLKRAHVIKLHAIKFCKENLGMKDDDEMGKIGMD
jgi:hypothetical protein